MDTSAIISLFFAVAVASLCLWAAWGDGRRFLIPNRIPAGIALLWFAYILLVPGTPPALHAGGHILAAAAVLAGGFLLFAAGWFGGGDVKLLAALALWAGPAQLPVFLFLVSVAGGLISLLLIVGRALPAGHTATQDRRVPYGIAIGAGGLYLASLVPAGTL